MRQMEDKECRIVENTLVPHAAFEEALSRIEQCFRYSEKSCEPICIALIGEARTGKTRVIEEFMAMHNPIRIDEGLYSPVLLIRTPSKPTVKGVVSLMLKAIGDPLYSKGTEITMTERLKLLMEACGTQMLIIDEFQHFIDKGSQKVAYHLSDWLKNLMDEIHVGLVVSGLPSCVQVIKQNEQLEGRFLAPIELHRFDWSEPDQRREFSRITGAFHDSLSPHFELPALDTPEMALRLYCATAGLMGYLTKLLRQVVWNARDFRSRTIGLTEFRSAHRVAIDWPKGFPSPFEEGFLLECDEAMLSQLRLSLIHI